MTNRERQMYVDIIRAFYGSSIYVDEDMISDEVVAIIQKMLNEIRKCNVNLAVFTATANALAAALEDSWRNFGIPDPLQLIEDIFKGDDKWLDNQKRSFGEAFIEEFVKQWFAIINNQRQAKICLVNTARNYKSALAIALLGL